MRTFLSLILAPFIWVGVLFFSIVWCGVAILVNRFFPAWSQRSFNHWAPPLWSQCVVHSALPRVRVWTLAPAFEPTVFMSNHLSTADIPVLMSYLPPGFKFLSKKQNFSIPFIGAVMKILRFIPIDRENKRAAVASMDQVAEVIRQEKMSIWVSPEGTRSRDGNLGQFKKGPFFLSRRAAVPITPVLLIGTDRMMPRKSLFLRARIQVDVLIGAPPQKHLHTDTSVDELREQTRQALLALKDLYEKDLRHRPHPFPWFGCRRIRLLDFFPSWESAQLGIEM